MITAIDPVLGSSRDKTIDGFRAIAVSGVVFAHAVLYRFQGPENSLWHFTRRVAEPIAQTSVLLFFVISGFIITTLLLREGRSIGRIGLRAFYVRRLFRILPPLAGYLLTLCALRTTGLLRLGNDSLAASVLFGCNTGIVYCDWWVAHTWSLAVEEQFYLAWPLLLVVLPPRLRVPVLVIALSTLLLGFLLTDYAWHSNYISFSCIIAGVLYAVSPRMQGIVVRGAHPIVWIGVAILIMVGPMLPFGNRMQALLPFLIVYLIFAARQIPPVRAFLSLKPFQIVALGSYSLYLWQQLFLAKPGSYDGNPPSLLLLPIAVAASVILIEQPFIRLGRRQHTRLPTNG